MSFCKTERKFTMYHSYLCSRIKLAEIHKFENNSSSFVFSKQEVKYVKDIYVTF